MKRLFLPLIACIACFFLSACASRNFTGLWIAPDSEKVLFELDLVRKGDRVEGYHSAILSGGNQIDSVLRADNAAPSIMGTVVDGGARVQFEVRNRAGGGEAFMKLVSGKKMVWTRISTSGGQTVPETCILIRQPQPKH